MSFKSFVNIYLVGLCILCLFSCKKTTESIGDIFIQEKPFIPELKIQGVGLNFISITWGGLEGSASEQVRYDVFLNGSLIMKDVKGREYGFRSLKPGTEYNVKIVASINAGITIQKEQKISTLAEGSAESKNFTKVLDKLGDYKVTIFSCVKNQDNTFLGIASSSAGMMVYKIDSNGNILWYRILPKDYNYPAVKDNQTAYLFSVLGDFITINQADGTIVNTNELPKKIGAIYGVRLTSNNDILITSIDALLILKNGDPSNYEYKPFPNWITSPQFDKDSNIYFKDPFGSIIYKYSASGQLLKTYDIPKSIIYFSTFVLDPSGALICLYNWGGKTEMKKFDYNLKVLNEVHYPIDFSQSIFFWNNNNDVVFLSAKTLPDFRVLNKDLKVISERNVLPNLEHVNILVASQLPDNSYFFIYNNQNGSGYITRRYDL